MVALPKQVSVFLQLDFWSLVGFVGSLFDLQQLLIPILSSKCLQRKSLEKVEEMQKLSFFDFSRFHHDSLRDTLSWKRVVKNDCVRSCLVELESSPLSKPDINPIHCVLMFLPYFLLVPSKTRCIQVNFLWIFMFLVHWIHSPQCLPRSGALAHPRSAPACEFTRSCSMTRGTSTPSSLMCGTGATRICSPVRA